MDTLLTNMYNSMQQFSARYLYGLAQLENVGAIVVGGAVGFPNVTAFNDSWIISSSTMSYKQGGFFPYKSEEIASVSTIINNIPSALFCGGFNGVISVPNCFYTTDGINYISSPFPPQILNCALLGLQGASLASSGSTVYMSGGSDNCATQTSFVTYVSIDGGITWSSSNVISTITPRFGHQTLLLPNGTLLLAGGYDFINQVDLNEIYISNDQGVTFNQVLQIAPFAPRGFFSLLIFENNLWVIGGLIHKGSPSSTNNIWTSNLNANNWTIACASPSEISSFISATIDSSPNSVNPVIFVGSNGQGLGTNQVAIISNSICGGTVNVVSALISSSFTSSAPSPFPSTPYLTIQLQQEANSSFSAQNIGAVVGGVVCALVVIALLILVIVLKKNQDQSKDKAARDNKSVIDDEELLTKPTSVIIEVGRQKNESVPLMTDISPQIDTTDLILQALSERNNLSIDVKTKAKMQIINILNDMNIIFLTNLVISRLKVDNSGFRIKSLSEKVKSQAWFPEDGDDSMFLVGASKNIQRNQFFTLIGDLIPEDSEDEITRGLIKPLNLLTDGQMEGVNSVVFKAIIDNRTVVIKCQLPLSDSFAYASHFAIQEFEFSIPISLPPHPHIIPILHRFTASSVLVYPWINKELRGLSDQLKKINGKGFIKRQATYVVLDYYPSTLRSYKREKIAKFNETELLLIALQLFKGISHLSEYKVVHRDLKDDNIFIQEDGALIIANFGCALECDKRFYLSKKDITNRIGSNSVTPPEIFLHLKVGPTKSSKKIDQKKLWEIFEKNDIFSIGVLLYSLIDISALPSSSNRYSKNDIPLFPSSDFSNACISFMSSLLAYNPGSRPSAKEAVRHLELLLFGPKKEDCLNKETIEKWLIHKRLDLFFNIPSNDRRGGQNFVKFDDGLSNVYQKAMLEFFINIDPTDLINTADCYQTI